MKASSESVILPCTVVDTSVGGAPLVQPIGVTTELSSSLAATFRGDAVVGAHVNYYVSVHKATWLGGADAVGGGITIWC